MINNNLVSSKSVIAKVIADLDLKEEDIKITDIRQWIGEAMEKIGAIQQLEHKVVTVKVDNYQAKLPCDLYRLDQVAFSFNCSCGWLPMRKVTNSFDIYKQCNKNKCKDMLITDAALIPIVKNIYNLIEDKDAITILNTDRNVKDTLSALLQQYTVPSINGRIVLGNPELYCATLQYSTKPGYINVNIPEGWLKISYYAIYTDEEGMPMIPDMDSYFEAIFWYVAMKLSYPKYLKGQLSQNIYYDMKNSYNFYRRQAYAEAMAPTTDELRTIQNIWHKLYPEFDDHNTFFEYTGDKQIIYNQDNL